MIAATEKVFISHSSKNKEFVRSDILPQVKLAKRNHWFDEEDIKGGDNYREELLKNVLGCQRLLIVVSKEALESEWVKEELTVATKHILEKGARIDARMVHRRILPVKIDERDKYGAKIESNKDVDLFSLHPYLTLVNYIAVPHNAELNKWLKKHASSDFEESLQAFELEEQRESIREYKTARDRTRQNVVTALRHPNALRYGFGRFGRVLSVFAKPAVQRVALGVCLGALFLMIQLVVGEVNAARFKPEIRPEIKIDIKPLSAATNLHRNATTYVAFQSDEDQTSAQAVGPPLIGVIELSMEEAEAIAGDTNVWQIQATAPNGHQTRSYFQLDAKIPPPPPPEIEIAITKDGENVDPGNAVEMEAGKPMELAFHVTTKNVTTSLPPTVITLQPPPDPEIEITITKNGQPVTRNALKVEPGKATDLSIVASVANAAVMTRPLQLQPLPAEIEVAIDGKPVTFGTADDPRPIPPSATSMQVRLKNDPEWTYAMLPGAPEIEVAIDNKLVPLGTAANPTKIPPSARLMQVRLKDDPEWTHAMLPGPPKIEVAIDDNLVSLGTAANPTKIPPSASSMQVRLENDQEWTYAALPGSPRIEVAIDDNPVSLGTAANPTTIQPTAALMQVRLENDPEWTYAKLPPTPDPVIRHVPDDAYYTALYEVYGRGRMVADLKKQIEIERINSERQRIINQEQRTLLERTRTAPQRVKVERDRVTTELANTSVRIDVEQYDHINQQWNPIDREEQIDVSDWEQTVRVKVTINDNDPLIYWKGTFYCGHGGFNGDSVLLTTPGG